VLLVMKGKFTSRSKFRPPLLLIAAPHPNHHLSPQYCTQATQRQAHLLHSHANSPTCAANNHLASLLTRQPAQAPGPYQSVPNERHPPLPPPARLRRRINRLPRPPMIGVIIQRHRQTLIGRPARAAGAAVAAGGDEG